MPARSVVVGLVLLMLGIVLLGYFRGGDDEIDVASAETSGYRKEDPGAVSTGGERESAGAQTAPIGAGQASNGRDSVREPRPEPALTGRVRDSSGEPVSGASVTWVPLPDHILGTWRDVVAHVQASARAALTDESGEFRFDTLPESGRGGSAVWVSHPGHELLRIDLPAERDAWRQGGEHVLDRSHGTTARVEKSGEPVAGARIHQIVVPAEAGGHAFHRELRTDSAGRTALQPTSTPVVLVAEHGGDASAPWSGVLAGPVLLELSPTFELTGEVRRDAGLSDSELVTITCFAREGPRSTELARVEGVLREWGPVELPVLDVDEYVVRMRGEGIVPRDVFLEPPDAGESVHVTQDARHGNAVWFLVVDEQEAPLPAATAVGSWFEEGRRIEAEGRAREDGYLRLAGLSAGAVNVQISCPGYAPSTLVMSVPEAEPVTTLIVLHRAGRVSGRCLAGGEPVEDFEVSVWPEATSLQAATHVFTGRPDGSFEVASAPRGRCAIAATVPGLGISDPVRVDVGEAPVSGVVLEIPETIRARGRVVDATTGLPIAEARAQVQLEGGGRVVRRVGSPLRVRADGSFEIEGLQRGATSILIEAEKYSSQQVDLTTSAGEEVELGVVPLAPRQPLLVRLSAGGGLDSSRCQVSARNSAGVAILEPRSFDALGEVRYESVGAGPYAFQLDLPDGTTHRLETELVAGEEWVVDFDLSARGEIHVEVVEGDRGELPADAYVSLEYASEGKSAYVLCALEDGEATLSRVAPGFVQVVLHTSRGVLARKRLTVEEGSRESVRFAVGEEESPLRVVTPEGDPLSGVTVIIHLGGVSTFAIGGDVETGPDGTCRIPGLADLGGILHLMHPVAGRRTGIEVPPRSPDEEVVLVLNGDSDLGLGFVDPRGPVRGVRAALYDAGGTCYLDGSFTDDSGRVVWRNLSPGDYKVYVDHPRYWPVERIVEVHPGGGTIAIPLWKRCDLDLLVREAGLPRADLDLDVVHVESGLTLDEILADPLVRSSATTATTDSTGRLTARGVPEGEYRWSVPAGEDGLGGANGSFLLAPGGGELRIGLP